MDKNIVNPESGEKAEKEEISRRDKIKRTPPLNRSGSVGAIPAGEKEWFQKLLRTEKGKTKQTVANMDLTEKKTNCIDLTSAEVSEEKKRPRLDKSFVDIEQNRNKRGKRELNQNEAVEKTLQTMCDQIAQIGKFIAEAHNPKRELKDTVVRLLQQTENLKKLKKTEGGKEQDQADGILEENESLKAKLEKMEKRIQELE